MLCCCLLTVSIASTYLTKEVCISSAFDCSSHVVGEVVRVLCIRLRTLMFWVPSRVPATLVRALVSRGEAFSFSD